jgi:predicted porin
MNTFLIRALVLTLEKFAMKKTLIALAALAVSGAAFAQSTVTISGTLDPSYSKATTTTAAGAKSSATVLGNSQQGTTNIRFSATEDLGGGLKAMVTMEQNFDSTDGSNGAYTVGEIFTALSGGFGTIRLGAANSPTLGVQAGRSPFGTKVGSGYATTSGAANTRNDDSIVYTSPTMGGFSIGVASALKVAGGAAAKNDIALNYAAGPLVVGVSSVSQKATIAQTNLMARYNLGFATVYAGYVTEDNKAGAANSKKKGSNIGIAAPMGALTLMANVASWDVAGGTAGDRDITAVGVKYDLSKRTSTYARMVTDKTKGGSKVQTTLVGLQHNF